MQTDRPDELSFWDHLEELRGCLLSILAALVVATVVAFCFKEPLFELVLAPAQADFYLYRWLGAEPFALHLVNTLLAEQMLIHIKVALTAGLLAVSPYIIYKVFGFVAPALYTPELRVGRWLTLSAYAMFLLGVALNYLLIFPLTVRFLGTYQVSAEVANMLTISSYVDTLLLMSIVFGIVFEIPVLSWLLARFGLLRAGWMQHYRRHAIVAVLIVAAVITPTADAFTLCVVSLPIWLLYEASILIVRIAEK